ncbi:MAG: hypothetical protein KAG18_09030, partial [Sinobacterium sp.]|nr:hypothetical protein [Sinobacterium sp.]
TSPSTGVTQAVAANKNKPKTKTKPISLPLIIPAAPKKPAVTLAELSAEELDKRKKRLDFLLLMENIPNSVKAVIRAKNRALNNISAEPYLGSSPKIELSFIEGQNKGKSEWAELNHLGNNQYMNTVSISSGFQQFHVAHLKFTKRIDAIYHGKKAIIIIDAIDKENPTFEIYPVALEKPEYFLY